MKLLQSSVSLAWSPTVSERDLGFVAHFTRTLVGSPLENDSCKAVTVAVNCYKRKHLSVFEFADLVFDVECPIFIARQLMRHRNGTFMEKSLRCLSPSYEACQVKASYTEPISAEDDYVEAYRSAVDLYDQLVAGGERKEMARAVLPLSTPTEFLWRISLRSLFNVFEQRLHPSAQRETREVVKKMYEITDEYYPNIMRAWSLEHGDMAIK